jgi:hypothetical protein
MKTDINPKRRSKISRLPKAIREELNLMIEEGASYQEIIDWLASKGHPDFNENNLFKWRQGGYQDWRLDHERKEEAKALRQWSRAIAVEKTPTVLANALSNFTAAKLHRLLCTLDLSVLTKALQERPEVCIRYFNSILRTGRISLESARVRHACREKTDKRAPTQKEVFDLFGFGPPIDEHASSGTKPTSSSAGRDNSSVPSGNPPDGQSFDTSFP